jgi:DNA-damage-inducible protein J
MGYTMGRSALVQARVDQRTKSQAQTILDALDLSMSQAINLFLKQVVLRKAIPFEIKIPTPLTERTFDKTDREEELHRVGSVEELLRELND